MSESKPQKDEYETNKLKKKASTMAGTWGRLNSILHTTPLWGFCNRKRWCNRRLGKDTQRKERPSCFLCAWKILGYAFSTFPGWERSLPVPKVQTIHGCWCRSAAPRMFSLLCCRTVTVCILSDKNKPLFTVFKSQERRQQSLVTFHRSSLFMFF